MEREGATPVERGGGSFWGGSLRRGERAHAHAHEEEYDDEHADEYDEQVEVPQFR
jgi:hypothetical protein